MSVSGTYIHNVNIKIAPLSFLWKLFHMNNTMLWIMWKISIIWNDNLSAFKNNNLQMHKNSNGTIFCCEFVSTIGLSTIKCINYDKSTSLKYTYTLHNEKS